MMALRSQQGMGPRQAQPLGVVLAGGRGRRMGGAKATVRLAGRPLISYPLRALSAALGEVVVLAKADTPLPTLPGATVWIELQQLHHPLVGIVEALALADGRAVLVCGGELPCVTPELVRRIAAADARGAPAVLAAERGQVQPLLGRYQPDALALLSPLDPDRPLRDQVVRLRPLALEVDDPEDLFAVNAPEDLSAAATILDRRRPAARRPRER